MICDHSDYSIRAKKMKKTMMVVLAGLLVILIVVILRFAKIASFSEITSLLIIGSSLISLSILGRKIL
jgi:preprotein translocase subunit SecF